MFSSTGTGERLDLGATHKSLKIINLEPIKAQNTGVDNKKLLPSFLDRFQCLDYSVMKSAKADFT
jgi:hypothetical protein